MLRRLLFACFLLNSGIASAIERSIDPQYLGAHWQDRGGTATQPTEKQDSREQGLQIFRRLREKYEAESKGPRADQKITRTQADNSGDADTRRDRGLRGYRAGQKSTYKPSSGSAEPLFGRRNRQLEQLSVTPKIAEEIFKTAEERGEVDKAIETVASLKPEQVQDRYVSSGVVKQRNATNRDDALSIPLTDSEALLTYELTRLYLKAQADEKRSLVKEEKQFKREKNKYEIISIENYFKKDLGSKSESPLEELSKSSLDDLSKAYLSLAAQQFYSNSAEASDKFKSNLDLANDAYEQSIRAANSLDANSASDATKSFSSFLNSKSFLENADKVFDGEEKNTFIASVKAAELLSSNESKLNPAQIALLASAFELSSGVAAPPCVGCFAKDGNLAEAKLNYFDEQIGFSKDFDSFTNEILSYFDQTAKNKYSKGKDLDLLVKGHEELTMLIDTLKLYKSLGQLSYFKIPHPMLPSALYRNSVETASAILNIVSQSKGKKYSGVGVPLEIKKLNLSASDYLKKLQKSHSAELAEKVLRSFFENTSNNYNRNLWRKYESAHYKNLRAATAAVILSRSVAMFSKPYFEKETPNRLGLAQLVWEANQFSKKQKELAEKKAKIEKGILELNPIPMFQDRKPTTTSVEAIVIEEEDPRNYPSFDKEAE